MSPDYRQKLKAIFEAALIQTFAIRGVYLDFACAAIMIFFGGEAAALQN